VASHKVLKSSNHYAIRHAKVASLEAVIVAPCFSGRQFEGDSQLRKAVGMLHEMKQSHAIDHQGSLNDASLLRMVVLEEEVDASHVVSADS
jgi:hypothetical protein